LVLPLIACLLFILSRVDAIFIPNNHPYIQYVGRMTENYEFAWSGFQIYAEFTGTSVGGEIVSGNNWFNIFVDNQLTIVNRSFSITGLEESKHEILISKRTEASLGVVTFKGFYIDDGARLLSPAPRPNRRIEIIGDSISCGFGNEGTFPCPFTPETENNWLTYGPLTARSLNADYYLEAWSGRGMVRNYGDSNVSSLYPFPVQYPFILPNDFNGTSKWDFSQWIPHAIIINLGTNDYSTSPYPSEELFTSGYIKFINFLQNQYQPPPIFFLCCGPMLSGFPCSYIQSITNIVGAFYVDLQNILNNSTDLRCEWHPSVKGQEKITEIIFFINETIMKW